MTHYAYLLPLTLTLAACTSDQLALPQEGLGEEPQAGIVVGGRYAATRGVPTIDGQCTANKAKIWIWRHEQGNDLKPKDMTMPRGSQFQQEISLVDNIVDGEKVKGGECTFTDNLRDHYYTAYAITCLGYKDGEYNKSFTCSTPKVGDTMTTPTLTLKKVEDKGELNYHTPDLYFGMLNLEYYHEYNGHLYRIERIDDMDDGGKDNDGDNGNNYGIFLLNNTRTAGVNKNTQCTFTLQNNKSAYRIVSHVALELHNVKTTVSRLELVTDNVPTQITLCGGHGGKIYKSQHTSDNGRYDANGYIYPISAASAQAVHDYGWSAVGELPDYSWWDPRYDALVLASANLDNNVDDKATVTLEANLLPSTIGRKLYLRVYYRSDILVPQPGGGYAPPDNPLLYPIEPLQNAVLLDGPNAKYDNLLDNVDPHNSASYADPRIYILPHDDNTFEKGLYVYNASSRQFFSYSNVKLKITGDYKDLVTVNDRSAFTLEVEPAFEQSHHYTAQ